ncbi:ubiquitin carboxyl-terminal hydrolase 2 [Nilaparvata lugens]|uniref:ubiquitin carboxyl-terminal hydrolase 2 n=1 Tax=Nilaparvata lugens TaxID=108931 RepID=UPI00193D8C94|nr:ubiquitin carboxyl-terminal hydrolase 2 [Nilaparvata lugens]
MTSLKYSLERLHMLKPTPGLTGLRNIGNTCFLNSIVQCLSNTRHLRYYILTNAYKKDIRSDSQGDLIVAFANLLKEIWSGSVEVANTALFKSQVQRFAPRFMGYSQQDAQEFLRYLLEGLHKDVNSADRKNRRRFDDLDDLPEPQKALESWNQYLQLENSFVVNLFVGQLKSTLTFPDCGHRSTTYEVFWDISLPIPTRSSNLQLSDCFDYFMQDETLDGDNVAKCSRCKKLRPCTKRYSIHKFPRVLVVHLKRFSPTERFRKLNVNVEFPVDGLDLTPYTDHGQRLTENGQRLTDYGQRLTDNVKGSVDYVRKSSDNVRNPVDYVRKSVDNMRNPIDYVKKPVEDHQIMIYDLYAVSNHSGSSQYGHYTAACRHPDTKQWHFFNDSNVSPLGTAKVVTSQAYVLFYEQRMPEAQEIKCCQ